MRSIVEFPGRFAGLVWGFIHPHRTAGRIELGRFAIVIALITAVIFVGYTMTKKSIRLPFSQDPYTIEVVFSEAKGLDALDEPAAAVAGTPLGRVTDVRLEDGRAVATLVFDPEVEGKIFADATAQMRPASAIQNLVVNVNPGTPELGPLPDGERIEASQTSSYVTVDELTRLVDTDTQAYVQILISEAARGLRGREGPLREGIRELGRLSSASIPVSRALAERRDLLSRLVGQLDRIFSATAARGQQLGDAVEAANDTLAVTASRDGELTAVTRELAPTLVEARRSLEAARRLSVPLLPALEDLLPAAAPLAAALPRLHDALPLTADFIERLGLVTLDARRPLRDLLHITRTLKRDVGSKIPGVRDFRDLARVLSRYRDGIAQTADTLSGALSVQDTGGPYAQIAFLKFEAAQARNFGFPEVAGRRGDAEHSKLEVMLARALEQECRRDTIYACIARFQIPGLPSEPVTERGR
jgi:phospholipid/cholesterol/gamma-HCH transport system substrate-binding protein